MRRSWPSRSPTLSYQCRTQPVQKTRRILFDPPTNRKGIHRSDPTEYNSTPRGKKLVRWFTWSLFLVWSSRARFVARLGCLAVWQTPKLSRRKKVLRICCTPT